MCLKKQLEMTVKWFAEFFLFWPLMLWDAMTDHSYYWRGFGIALEWVWAALIALAILNFIGYLGIRLMIW